MKFNKSFYTPNTQATLEEAEKRMVDSGYSNFNFKSLSRTNGASFYFELENGDEVRVSDHKLTGKRAFNTIQIPLYEISYSKRVTIEELVDSFKMIDGKLVKVKVLRTRKVIA